MNKFHLLRKEMYVGSTGSAPNYIDTSQTPPYIITFKDDDYVDQRGDPFSSYSLLGQKAPPPRQFTPKTTDTPILQVLPYTLGYDGVDSIYISKVVDSNQLELYKLKIRKYKFRVGHATIDSDESLNLAEKLINFGYPTGDDNRSPIENWIDGESNVPKAAILTTYGDLLVVEYPTNLYATKIFFSMARRTLEKRGKVFKQRPNDPTTDTTMNISFKYDGVTKFNIANPFTWAWAKYNFNKLNPARENDSSKAWLKYVNVPLNPSSYLYFRVGSRFWFNALLVTGNDLQMVTYNDSNTEGTPRSEYQYDVAVNRVTVAWSLSHVTGKTFTGAVGSLILTPTSFALYKTDGTVLHELASNLVSAAFFSINSIGDLIITDSSSKQIWGFFASLIEKPVVDLYYDIKAGKVSAGQRYNSSGFIEGSMQPVLKDPGKMYTLIIINAVIVTCKKGISRVEITDYLKDYIYKNIKTAVELSTTGLDYANVKFWDHMTIYFNCTTDMTIEIEWMFNGKTDKKTFKYGEKIILTSENECGGTYGPCINNEKKWEKVFDGFPITRVCYPKLELSCTSPSPSASPSPSPSPSATPTESPSPSPSPSSTPTVYPSPSPFPEAPWYENKLYIGLIAGGVFLFIIIMIVVLMKKRTPEVPQMV